MSVVKQPMNSDLTYWSKGLHC